MRSYIHFLTIFFIFVTFYVAHYSDVHAQTNDGIYGLAMHGQTKYSADDAHLTYANPDAPKGGHIKMSAIGTFDTLNPYALKGQAPENMNLVYDRLMRRVWDEPFTMYPLIAQRVEVADDRSSITFHINPNARFHDNSPITAQDVLFSYETLKEHGRPNMRRIYKFVNETTINAPLSITFSLGDGYDRETVMILAMMPVLSKAWWSDRNFNETLTDLPLLNGPYQIESFDVGRNITYKRIKDYWAKDLLVNKGHYNFERITYDYYRDDTIALESFKKGDLDIRREWDITKWQTAYDGLSDDIVKRSVAHQRPERAHGFIFNMRRSPFDDIRVRQALSLAFDENWVSKNLFHNEFKRITSYYPNSILDGSGALSDEMRAKMREWKDDIKPAAFADQFMLTTTTSYRKRLREADNILKDAGWIVVNGKRINQNTQEPLTFEIMLGSAHEEKIALTYQRSLERLGIDMNIRVADSATFQKRKNDYQYDMIAFYWQNSLSPGTEQTLYWSCAAAKEPSRFNFSGICNPALDYFSNGIANAKTYNDLTLNAHIIDRILLSEYISIPLFYKGFDYIAHKKNIRSPEQIATYGAVIETWWQTPKTEP